MAVRRRIGESKMDSREKICRSTQEDVCRHPERQRRISDQSGVGVMRSFAGAQDDPQAVFFDRVESENPRLGNQYELIAI